MLTPDGPRLVEYNVRFGDPECQALMLRLDSDLLELMLATARGALAAAPPPVFSDDAALVVVMAAKGYPGTPEKGGRIVGPRRSPAPKIFHAGTALEKGRLVAAGGRVLGVAARGADVSRRRSVPLMRRSTRSTFPGGFCRRDIGWREIARKGRRGL